jgi:hypothetical protein
MVKLVEHVEDPEAVDRLEGVCKMSILEADGDC